MKIGDLVKPKNSVLKGEPHGIIVEIKHPNTKHPDYRAPTTIKCSFNNELTKKFWFYRHELEIVLG